MSNARSPREVCSTTIGTSGLIVLASFASSAGFLPNVAIGHCRSSRFRSAETPGSVTRTRPASTPGCPELSGAGLLLVRRPQLVAGLGLFHADRFCLPHEQLQRLPVGHVLTHSLQPIGLAQPLEQLI